MNLYITIGIVFLSVLSILGAIIQEKTQKIKHLEKENSKLISELSRKTDEFNNRLLEYSRKMCHESYVKATEVESLLDKISFYEKQLKKEKRKYTLLKTGKTWEDSIEK